MSDEEFSEEDLLPSIEDYLEIADTSKRISSKGLEELVLSVRVRTGLSVELCRILVVYFFSEIRNAMLRGDIVHITKFGQFSIACPKNSHNKKQIFPKFKLYKKFMIKLNKK